VTAEAKNQRKNTTNRRRRISSLSLHFCHRFQGTDWPRLCTCQKKIINRIPTRLRSLSIVDPLATDLISNLCRSIWILTDTLRTDWRTFSPDFSAQCRRIIDFQKFAIVLWHSPEAPGGLRARTPGIHPPPLTLSHQPQKMYPRNAGTSLTPSREGGASSTPSRGGASLTPSRGGASLMPSRGGTSWNTFQASSRFRCGCPPISCSSSPTLFPKRRTRVGWW